MGGFEDVIDPPAYSKFTPLPKDVPKRKQRSLLQTLLRYFNTKPPGFIAQKPTTLSLSYYPIRIVTSEWMLYNSILSRYVKYYESSIHTLHLDLQEDDLQGLQPWRRRSRQSMHKLRLIETFVKRHKDTEPVKEPWDEVLSDIDHISSQMSEWAKFLESMVPMATSMLQLTDSRRSQAEARNVKRLTYVALFFIPLSFVAGLFSMAEYVAPWGERFWLYLAVAVPLLLFVLGLSALPFERLGGRLVEILRATVRLPKGKHADAKANSQRALKKKSLDKLPDDKGTTVSKSSRVILY